MRCITLMVLARSRLPHAGGPSTSCYLGTFGEGGMPSPSPRYDDAQEET